MAGYRKALLLVVVASAVAGFAWWKLQVDPVRRASAIGGQLELAAGDVKVERDGVADATVSGMPLPDGAQITTGKGARALLRLSGGGSAFLGDDTALKLAGNGVALNSGRIWLDIPSLPQPVVHDVGFATVAVGNAGLSVTRRADAIEVYVARGLAVVAAAKGRREVAAGEQAIVSKGGEVKVEPVSFWDDWTGGMADRGVNDGIAGAGSGKLYAIDRTAAAGTPSRPLEIKRQSVRARIADGIAETEVDQTFWNPGDRPVEGYYWFTVPEHALVTGFALETNGVLIEGEVVERKEAVAKYEAAVERANDPALLEWINGRSYRARIFPIPGVGSRRVVLRYVEPVALGDGRIRWVYPLAHGQADTPTIDEFSLALDLGALGADATISTLPDARVENGGRMITMRRSVYSPRADFQVEVVPKKSVSALRATRFESSADQADFVMLRWVPDLDWGVETTSSADVVLALDVSAGGDDADRQLKFAVAEAALRNLAAGDHFAVMTTDVQPRIVYPDSGLAPADPAHVAQALERLASTVAGGATDLGAMFDPGLSRLHAAEQPALIYIGDGLATSGELGGAQLVERLRRSLEGARARFFSIGVGADANHALLERLAAVGGGWHFRVDDDERAVREALQLTAAIKTPTITDLELDVGVGLDEPLSNVSGKIAHGQELVLLARTHHELPKTATIRGRIGGKPFSRAYDINLQRGAATSLVPRLWAAEFARRLIGRTANPDEARGKVVSLSLEYGLVTPFSSILALDSEAAYQQMGIPRARRPWDRLPAEQASLNEPSSLEHDVLETALAVALAPVTLLTGCDNASPATVNVSAPEAPMEMKERSYHAEQAASAEPAPTPSPTSAPASPSVAMEEASARSDRDDAPKDGLEGMLAGDSVAESYGIVGLARGGGGVGYGSGLGSLGTAGDFRSTRVAAAKRAPEPSKAAIAVAPVRRRVSAYLAARVCSDVASRPLADRAVMWARRLRSVTTMAQALSLYDSARAACEISGQRDQRTLLGQLERFATNAEAAEELFAHFAHDSDAVALLARHVLRRTLDPYVAAVARRESNGGSVDWVRVDLELAAMSTNALRIERLRTLLLGNANDVEGELRLMRLLLREGKRDEALPMASRLRQRGLFSPLLLRDLGDIQVEAGLIDEALRTYTEIIEFDPESAEARRLVGDTLLANGWYDVAYRQFRTLVQMTPGDVSSEIRQAVAAAGTGRTDEALRILRRVAESDAEPGDNDPRLHARLLASALLGRLLGESTADATRTEALSRQLKQLQVLPSAGRLCVLTWDALDVSLGLGVASGDIVDAPSVGLFALSGCQETPDALAKQVVVRNERGKQRSIGYTLHELTFDGKKFNVSVTSGKTS